ncbi:MAG TPA: serine hydrolase domain-containing protein, partial [Acidimicrobiia bacterium]
EDAEYDLNDYMMPVPVQDLVTTEDFLPVLDGFPTKFAAGEQFSYCNGGFVVLALIAERASGVPFHDLVGRRVLQPAGMTETEFLRSDQLPGGTALGYYEIDGIWRTNVFHLPVRGTGDGGIYTTVADVVAFWKAFFAGRIVSKDWVAEMVRPRSDSPSDERRYGLGFWLHESTDTVMLVGSDTGVSFRTVHEPHEDITHTVISNRTNGAWAMSEFLDERLGT